MSRSAFTVRCTSLVLGLSLGFHVQLTLAQEILISSTALDGAGFGVDGLMVTWTDRRNNAQGDIYAYDLATSTEFVVSNHSGPKMMPDIEGTRVVWMDSRTGIGDIYARVIGAGEQQLAGPGDSWTPSIQGGRAVWMDKRNGTWDIYMWDFTSGSDQRITTSGSNEEIPDINGDIIAWYDERNGGHSAHDVYMYDLSTGVETQVTNDPYNQTAPRLNAKSMVWKDTRTGTAELLRSWQRMRVQTRSISPRSFSSRFARAGSREASIVRASCW